MGTRRQDLGHSHPRWSPSFQGERDPFVPRAGRRGSRALSTTASRDVRALRPPRAVTFDYWRTLCDTTGSLDDVRAAALHAVLDDALDGVVDLDVVNAACSAARLEHEQAWRENRQFLPADATRSVLRSLAGHCRGDVALETRLAEAYETAAEGVDIPLLPGVADAVRCIADAGVAIGIVCDVGLAPSSLLVANLERHGLLGSFTHWSFSDTVGVYKPDARIFEHALQGLGVDDPAAAWHIGDLRRTDVAGARAYGMGTVRAAVVHDDHPDEGPEADAVITDYAQLRDVLGLA